MKTKIGYTAGLFIILITLQACKGDPDYNPFEKLDLKENCSVYFFLSEGEYGHFEKENQNFVIEDITSLQNLKDNWVFHKTNKCMPCGYGYIVFITQNGNLIETIDINTPCSYATMTGGWYDFNEKYYGFIDKSKIRKLEQKEADSIWGMLVK